MAFVNVTVEPEQDYPPTANAGYNQLIRLPKNEIFINGSQSTDDKVPMCVQLYFAWEGIVFMLRYQYNRKG